MIWGESIGLSARHDGSSVIGTREEAIVFGTKSARPSALASGRHPWRPLLHKWLLGWLLLRCPRCQRGKIFAGLFAMNRSCPRCGLVFQREPGYFLGAMYFSYFMAVAVIVPTFYVLHWVLPQWPGVAIAGLALLPYLPLTPLVFRYSRALWIYLDRYADPGE
jgi:uncharacterized protein (DUF983 family)